MSISLFHYVIIFQARFQTSWAVIAPVFFRPIRESDTSLWMYFTEVNLFRLRLLILTNHSQNQSAATYRSIELAACPAMGHRRRPVTRPAYSARRWAPVAAVVDL